MTLEQELASIKSRFQQTTPVTPEQVLEKLNADEQGAAEYTESPEQNADTLAVLNRYRVRYGASSDIDNVTFVELLAENKLLPDRPVVEDDRSIWTIIRNIGLAIDSKYCGWADSWTGKAVFYSIIALIIGFAFMPGALQRKESFDAGYQQCKLRADVGLPCP